MNGNLANILQYPVVAYLRCNPKFMRKDRGETCEFLRQQPLS